MRWIGLTGGIGSGKSTVAQLLRNNGIAVIDADEVAHMVTKKSGPGFGPVVSEFGPDIVGADGEIDRRKLGQVVFANAVKLEKLEKILHPLIAAKVKELREDLAQKGRMFAVYDVPLLFEKKMQKQFDEIIVVFCSTDNQIRRAMERTGLSEKEIRERLMAQIPLTEKLKEASRMIENDGTLAELEARVKKLAASFK